MPEIITQAERTRRFNEWLRTQTMPEFEELVERQRWWVHRVVEFDKILTAQDIDIVPGFYVDTTGKVIYDDKEK